MGYKSQQRPRRARNAARSKRRPERITGIGFKSADLIAERLGISRTAMVRARAGIAYTLAEAMANGRCGLAENELLVPAEKLLEIPSATLAEALQAELGSGEVVADLICITYDFL
jgi:exodeoxyribonuclease V alpha subunit